MGYWGVRQGQGSRVISWGSFAGELRIKWYFRWQEGHRVGTIHPLTQSIFVKCSQCSIPRAQAERTELCREDSHNKMSYEKQLCPEDTQQRHRCEDSG